VIGGTVKVDVSGAMALLSEAKQRRVTLKGVKAGAKLLKLAARSEAPARPGSGALQQAQGVKAEKGRQGKTISFAVQGARKNVVRMVRTGRSKKPQKAIPALYDHLVQLGTRPHATRKGSRLTKGKKAAVGQIGSAHPGAKANPYRRRAWARVKGEAGRVTLEAMAAELQKVLAKQAAKVK
jgi:hypothetical protein